MGDEGRPVRISVRDLVLIALLAAVGGVLSTYIGYIGNLINRLFGVPFGAGQIIAGLHIIWPLLARSLIGRFGSGTLTGLFKGMIEFLAGGTHGVVIVLVSFVEGLLVDLGMGVSRRPGLPLTMAAGAVASASNVFIFQALYFSGVSIGFILVMAGLSFVSGAFFGGYLTWDLRRLLVASRLVSREAEPRRPSIRSWRRHAVTGMVVLALLGGSVYYYVAVYDPFADPGSVRVRGAVETPYTFSFETWDGERASVVAELRGSVSYVPPRAYDGIPVARIMERAEPSEEATRVRVIADDGYEAAFDLARVMTDDAFLLTLDDGWPRLVAAEYEGSLWVRRVTRLVVE